MNFPLFCPKCKNEPLVNVEKLIMYGTEANGSKSTNYCTHCYANGAFTSPNITFEEMIELVASMMVKDFGFSPEDAKKQCNEGIPNLKR